MSAVVAIEEVDLATTTVRELNQRLHDLEPGAGGRWVVTNPNGAHAVAVGLDAEVEVEIEGHVGYYCAGMNKRATVRVAGNAGVGVAENMMSGSVLVDGDASQSAGATARGGLLVIRGSASARCGISIKGVDIVVRGSVGHAAGFMAQKGALVVCGDAGDGLGDSIYEARVYVRGEVAGLGADCVEKEIADEHRAQLAELLGRAEIDLDPADFRRYGSARRLYNFDIDNAGATDGRPRSARDARMPSRIAPIVTEFDALSKQEGFRPGLGGRWRPGLRESALFDRDVIHEIHRMAREGIYDIRGFGAKRRVPHFDDLLFLGASVSRYPLEGYRERCAHRRHARDAVREAADRARDPDHDRGDELRGALGAGEGGARARGERRRHLDHHRRRRDAPRGARPLRQARLPDPPLALRDEPRRPAAGRRDRGRRRPGGEAGRGRDAARPEDLRPGRRDARPAEGDRPAKRLPAPRLDRP